MHRPRRIRCPHCWRTRPNLLWCQSAESGGCPIEGFHTGYKKTNLAPNELIRTICFARRFSNILVIRAKWGPAMRRPFLKCALRGWAGAGGVVEDVRIALGSVAPVPLRLVETERLVTGKAIDPALLALAKKRAIAEIQPIDDIRSTARYRSAVVGNLVAEFLEKLGAGSADMSGVLARWNAFPWRKR